MKTDEFRHYLAQVTPDPSLHFTNHINHVLENVAQKKLSKRSVSSKKQLGSRILVFALIAVMLCTAAFAASQWRIFDALHFILGNQPITSDAQIQKILHQEIINDVEITIHETMYDGRTLFVQYGYRILNESEPFGILDHNGILQEVVSSNALSKLNSHNVGWWIDHIWINDQCIDMPYGSGTLYSGTTVAGEILITEYWRLDHLDINLSGSVSIALPIGKSQPQSEYSLSAYPEKYDADGNLLKPEKGLVSFTFDAGNVKDQITTIHPNIEAILPTVTAQVTETAFSPLMTYITLELVGNPDALAAYKAKNGDGLYDENGKLIWPYTSQDVHQNCILSLQLVDGNGKIIFPNYSGCSGVGEDWAEFRYPYIAPENMPDTLYLAPTHDETVDMSHAIRVK